MPELPDVEDFARLVGDRGVGQRIVSVNVRTSTILRGVGRDELDDRLRGHRICGAERHGKWLFVLTDGPQLVVHFGMTGSLRWTTPQAAWRVDDRVVIELDDGCLVISDRRNLGTVALATTQEERTAITGVLGPDAGSVTLADVDRLLVGRRSLKTTLLDQSTIAGLGNMLTDEVLWRACLDPARQANDLTADERARLHRSMRRTVSDAVRAGHIPRGPTWLSGQRAAPEPMCPRCARPLAWRRIGARSSLWCPACQNPAA